MGTLEGKVALVTGASRGIGVAIARRLASEGAIVAITARTLDTHARLPGTLRETVAAVEADGGRATAIAGDVQDPDARAFVVRRVQEELGPIDILVNNAAAAFYMPFDDVPEKRFRVAMEVNVRAPWDLCQRVLPDMKRRGRGWIVNISSASARHPAGPPYDEFHRVGGSVLYAATKAALDRMSTGLAAELLATGIAVNALSPVAAVLTPGAQAHDVVPEEFLRTAEPIELMAEATLALCEPREPMLTGRVAYTKPLLAELGRRVKTLDGRAWL
jgi:NAD(P)-dependent dehydrogenase (short-subunit alcohol dehydrogenase family)